MIYGLAIKSMRWKMQIFATSSNFFYLSQIFELRQ